MARPAFAPSSPGALGRGPRPGSAGGRARVRNEVVADEPVAPAEPAMSRSRINQRTREGYRLVGLDRGGIQESDQAFAILVASHAGSTMGMSFCRHAWDRLLRRTCVLYKPEEPAATEVHGGPGGTVQGPGRTEPTTRASSRQPLGPNGSDDPDAIGPPAEALPEHLDCRDCGELRLARMASVLITTGPRSSGHEECQETSGTGRPRPRDLDDCGRHFWTLTATRSGRASLSARCAAR